MNDMHILRIQCPDQKGLIAGITGVLFRNGLNIMVMKEFVEQGSNTFFARLEISGYLEPKNVRRQIGNVLPEASYIDLHAARKKDIVILVTKEHHCLGDLLVRHFFGELQANIKGVIGNYPNLESFTRKFEVPYFHVSHDGKNRDDFERDLLGIIKNLKPELLVLAKFMRILSPSFVAQYANRIINIHHSFLPAFAGASPYRQAYERGVKLIGATAHFVTNDLDEGPIITQKVISVDHAYQVAGMVKAGNEVEKSVLAEALKSVLEDRVFVMGNKTVAF